jgi:hypothetical protein
MGSSHILPGYLLLKYVVTGAQLRLAMPNYGLRSPLGYHYLGSRSSWSDPEQC